MIADAEIRLQLIEYQKRVFGTREVERKLALSPTIIPSAPPADNLEDALRSYTLSAAPTTAVDSQEQVPSSQPTLLTMRYPLTPCTETRQCLSLIPPS